MIPETHADLLAWDTRAFAHVATIGPAGEPQNNPVWIDFDGEHLLFSQLRTRQKFRNLERDPRVALSILDPDNPYRYLEVRGRVVEVVGDEGYEFINSMASKYHGVDEYDNTRPGDERVIMKVAPEHCTTMG